MGGLLDRVYSRLADSRVFAYGVMAAVVGAVLSPAMSCAPKDGYPLSTYPMFARKRGREATAVQVVAATTPGASSAVPGAGVEILGPGYLGTLDVLQAEATLSKAIRRGPAAAQELCVEVADRVASRGEPRGAREVLVRRIRVDAIDWFIDAERGTKETTVIARCAVGGAP